MKRGAGIRIWVTAGTPSVVRLQGEGRPAFCLDGVREGSDEGRMGLWPSNRFLLSGGRTGAVRLSGGRPEAGFWSEAAGEGHLSRRPQRGGWGSPRFGCEAGRRPEGWRAVWRAPVGPEAPTREWCAASSSEAGRRGRHGSSVSANPFPLLCPTQRRLIRLLRSAGLGRQC